MDDNNFRELELTGNLSFEKISCDKISVLGKCKGGAVSAQSLKISGTCEADSITAKNFSADGKIEVDSLTVEKVLEISGKPQINFVKADEILMATHNGFFGEIKCRKIKIYDEFEKINSEIFGRGFIGNFAINPSRSRVSVKNIEAETVHIENCEVGIVKCKEAFIGSNCVIEKLFVVRKCEVAADSTVGETIHT